MPPTFQALLWIMTVNPLLLIFNIYTNSELKRLDLGLLSQ
jgi:hypothetical protein